MKIQKIIHVFNNAGETYIHNGWTVMHHKKETLREEIQKIDDREGTAHLTRFDVLSENGYERLEFFKYIILFYHGGVFARYEDNEEIPFSHLFELVKYCNTRQISLFECPSAIVVGIMYHPHLMSMILDERFHPLSSLFKTYDMRGYKTLVTSLPLRSYLDKIKERIPEPVVLPPLSLPLENPSPVVPVAQDSQVVPVVPVAQDSQVVPLVPVVPVVPVGSSRRPKPEKEVPIKVATVAMFTTFSLTGLAIGIFFGSRVKK